MLSDTYKKNVLESCAKDPLKDLNDYIERVKIVSEMDCPDMVESANRVIRILKEEVSIPVNENLFKEPSEGMLYNAIKSIDESLEYKSYMNALEGINPSVEKFFADVLVMDKDEAVKNNRLALLTILKKKYEVLCDFSKL